MKKRILSLILAFVLCVGMLPAQVFAAQDGAVTVTLDPETVTFSPAETSALAASLMTLDKDGKVALTATNEVKWIDRLDLTGATDPTAFEEYDNNYALGFYDYLVNNSQGGDLLDADAREYTAVTFTGKATFAYTGDSAADEAAAYAAISEELDSNWNEALSHLTAVFYAFDRDHPEVFWLSGETMFTAYPYLTYYSDGTVTYEQYVCFVVHDDEEGFDIRADKYLDASLTPDIEWIKDTKDSVESRVTEVIDGIEEDMGTQYSRYDMLLGFHDYLTGTNCYNTSADLNSIDHICREAVSALQGGEGEKGPVCEGYARAFKVLCDTAGIPCVLVDGYATSDGTTGEPHMWNYVQMDDENWYAVDVTWDDPSVDGVTAAKSGYESMDYFLVGRGTEHNGLTFEKSHPVSNSPSASAPAFTNGPVLSDGVFDGEDDGTEVASGTCGDNLTWVLTDDGVLTISGEGPMADYSSSSDSPWYEYGESITEVVIGDGVTSIGAFAFSNLDSLLSVSFMGAPESIGKSAFSGSEMLPGLTLPEGLKTISSNAFQNCYGLTEITIPASVTSIGSLAFYNCKNMKSLVFIGDDVNVGTNAFGACKSLAEVHFLAGPPASMDGSAFTNVTATVYYPAGDASWDSLIALSFGGTLTWKAVGGSTEPTQLAAPTDLKWGKYYYSVTDSDTGVSTVASADYPGMISWVVGDTDHNYTCDVVVYKVSTDSTVADNPVFSSSWGHTGKTDRYTDHDFSLSFLPKLENGDYYFTVQAIGDNATTPNSEIVTSGTWTYARPETTLNAPELQDWDGTKISWNEVEGDNAGGYLVQIYYSAFGDSENMAKVYSFVSYNCEKVMTSYTLPDWLLEDYGTGYYYARVKAVSADVNAANHSAFTAFSEPYYHENIVTVNTEITGEGKIVLKNEAVVQGQPMEFSVTPALGYRLSSLYYIEGEQAPCYMSTTQNIYCLCPTESTVTIYATFTKLSEQPDMLNTSVLSVHQSEWYSDLNIPDEFSPLTSSLYWNNSFVRTVLVNTDGTPVLTQETPGNYTWMSLINPGDLEAGQYTAYITVGDTTQTIPLGFCTVTLLDAYPYYATIDGQLATGASSVKARVDLEMLPPVSLPEGLTLNMTDKSGNVVASSQDFRLLYNGNGNGTTAADKEDSDSVSTGSALEFTLDLTDAGLATDTGYFLHLTSDDGTQFLNCNHYEIYATAEPFFTNHVFDADTLIWTADALNIPAGTYATYRYRGIEGTTGPDMVITEDGTATIVFSEWPFVAGDNGYFWAFISVPYGNNGTYEKGFDVMYRDDSGSTDTPTPWYRPEIENATYVRGYENSNSFNYVIPYDGADMQTVTVSTPATGSGFYWVYDCNGGLVVSSGVADLSSFSVTLFGVMTHSNYRVSISSDDGNANFQDLTFQFRYDTALGIDPDFYGNVREETVVFYPTAAVSEDTFRIGYLYCGEKVDLPFTVNDDGSVTVDVSTIPCGQWKPWATVEKTEKDFDKTYEEPLLIGNWYFRVRSKSDTSAGPKVAKLVPTADADGILTAQVTYEGGAPASDVTMTVYRIAGDYLNYHTAVNIGTGSYTISASDLELDGKYLFYFTLADGTVLDAEYASFATSTGSLMYRHMEYNGSSYYEDPDAPLFSQWSTSIHAGGVVKFYFGTEGDCKAVDLDSLSAPGGVELMEEDGFVLIMGVAFGEYEIVYTDADGEEHTMPVSVGLPGLGFYTTPTASEKTYIDRFSVTGENNTFYLVPQWGSLYKLNLDDRFRAIAAVEIAEDGSYATVTVTGTPDGEWYELSADLMREDGTTDSDWWAGLHITNGTPHLMFRTLDEAEDGGWYDDPDRELSSRANFSISSGFPAHFYFGTEDNCKMVDPDMLSSTDGIELTVEGDVVHVHTCAFGSHEIIYTDDDGVKHSLPFTVDLPPLGFYTTPTASEKTYIDRFSVTGENNTFYLVPQWGSLYKLNPDDRFADIAEFTIAEDGSYATVTVTGTPDGEWYELSADLMREDGKIDSDWWAGLRITNGTPHLMFRTLDEAEDGGWYDDPDRELSSRANLSISSGFPAHFYFGTEDNCKMVDPDMLSSTDGIELTVEGDVVHVHTRAFGSHEIIYTDDDGVKHSLPFTVDLPPLGFYTETTASEDNYLHQKFTVTGENNTFYLVPQWGSLYKLNPDDRFNAIAAVEIAEDGSYATVTVTGTPDGEWYELSADLMREDGKIDTDWRAGLRITNGTPHLMFRHMSRDEEGNWYEETKQGFFSSWVSQPNSNSRTKFYFGTEASYEPVDFANLSVTDADGKTTDGIELTMQDGVIRLSANDFGDYLVVYTDADGKQHTMPVTVDLPDLGLYTTTDASKATYAYNKVTLTETNKSVYAVPLNGAITSVTLSDELARIADATVADDGSYATITVTGTPESSDYYYDLYVSFRRGESGDVSTWGFGLRIVDGTPHLMYRWADWDDATDTWYERTDEEFRSRWNAALSNNSIVKFYFGTENSCTAVNFSALRVTDADGEATDGIELEQNGEFTWMRAQSLGSYTVVYTDADGEEHSMPVTVVLPDVGFYTDTEPSEETHITSFAASKTNNTFYLVARNGKLNYVSLSEDFAGIATATLSEDGSYAIITVTGTPDDRWYDLELEYASDYDYTEIWNEGIHIEVAPTVLTRAAACVELVDALGWEYNGETCSFSDLPTTHEAYKAVSILVNRGIISGTAEGIFSPDGILTRAQMAKLLCAVLDTEGELNEDIRPIDVASTSWSAAYVCTVLEKNLMWTDEKGYFNPSAYVTDTDVNFFLLAKLAGSTIPSDDYAVSDIGFSENGSMLVWTEPETAQENTENTIRYYGYASKNGGITWDGFGSTRSIAIPLTNLDPGTYNTFKVETWVNDVFVAVTEIDDLTLTVELRASALPAVTVSVSTTASADGTYPVTISGLTANTEFFFITRSHRWNGRHGNYSGSTGTVTLNMREPEMQSHFADVTSIYQVQEVTGTARSADAKSATITLTDRSGWNYFNEQPADKAEKAVSNIHLELRYNSLTLCWNAPSAVLTGQVRYQIFLSENSGSTWKSFSRTSNTNLITYWFDSGVYNAVRILTLVDDVPVADCIAHDITLTITHTAGTKVPKLVSIPSPTEEGVYTLVISDAQANAEYILRAQSEYGGSSTVIYTDGNGRTMETMEWWADHFSTSSGQYLLQQIVRNSVGEDGKSGALDLATCGGWKSLADTLVDSDYFHDEEQQISNLRFTWNGDSPVLTWTEPTADADGSRNYAVYASADEGKTWTELGRTDWYMTELTDLDAGVYNTFKVETLVDNIVVASATANLTLTVTQVADSSSAQVLFFAPEEGTTGRYTISISGMPAYTSFMLALKSNFDTNVLYFSSDGTGSAHTDIGYNWMQNLLNNSGQYQLRRFSGCTINGAPANGETSVESGTTAAFTITAGDWSAITVSDADALMDPTKAATNLRFELNEWNDLPYLVWDAPKDPVSGEAIENLNYRVYYSTDRASWYEFNDTYELEANLRHLSVGTYFFKVATCVNGITVAETIGTVGSGTDTAYITLTVSGNTKPAADVKIVTPSGNDDSYLLRISGLTPNAAVLFRMQGTDSTSSSGLSSDSEGKASTTLWGADQYDTYLLQELGSGSVSTDGSTASFTVTNYGDWADLDDVIVSADDLKDPAKAVTNFRFASDEGDGLPNLVWAAPLDPDGNAYEGLYYRVYCSTDDGLTWTRESTTWGTEHALYDITGGTYLFKIATVEDEFDVAETSGFVTLTVTAGTNSNASVSFLTEDNESFNATITGLTPGAVVEFRLHDQYGYSGSSMTADENGTAMFYGWDIDQLEDHITYSVREIIPGTITDTAASVTLNHCGSGTITVETVKTFRVTFIDWNGDTLDWQDVKSGEDAVSPPDPERDGYEFTGWNGSYTNVTRDTAVYATYQKTSFTVYFYHNGEYTQAEVSDDGYVTPKTPVREGFEFLGWSTTPNSTVYWDFASDTVTSDLILYPNWAEDEITISVADNSAKILSPSCYSARPGEQLCVDIYTPYGMLITGVKFTYADGTTETMPTYGYSWLYFYAPNQNVTLEAVTKDSYYAIDVTLTVPEEITGASAWLYGPTNSAYQEVTGPKFAFENLTTGTYYLELGYWTEGGFYRYITYTVEVDGTSERVALPITIEPILSVSGTITNLSDVTSDDCYVELYDENGWWVSNARIDPATGAFRIYGVTAGSAYTAKIWTSAGNYLPISVGGTVVVSDASVTDHEITLANASNVFVNILTEETNPAFEVYFDIYKKESENYQSWVTGGTASGENGTVCLYSSLISEPGTYIATLHYAYARNWTLLDFIPVSYPVEVTQSNIDNGVPVHFNLDYKYPDNTNPESLIGYGNLVALDRSEAYPGDVVTLSVRYRNNDYYSELNDLSFRVVLPDGIKFYDDNATDTHTVESLGIWEAGSFSVPLQLTENAEDTLKIQVMASIGNENEFLFGSAALTVPTFTLNAPVQAQAGESFTVSGQAAPGSTVFIKNADTNLLLAVAQTTGTFYSAEITASAGTLRLIAQTANDSSDVVTVDVAEEEPLTATELYYNGMKASWNKKLNAFSFWQYVDLDLMGYDLYVDVTFNWADIKSVELTFCSQTLTATRDTTVTDSGHWISETPFANWGGSGLKPIVATITTSDDTVIEMTVAYVNLLIDPSGVVYDEDGKTPLEGAVVTLQVLEDGMWVDWDAESCGQSNPRVTGADGKYAWVVPNGTYRILVSRDGYEDYNSLMDTRYSENNQSTIIIPPPRTDINVTMTRKALNVTPIISEMGRVNVPATAKIGDTVTVTNANNEGYRLTDLVVTDAKGNRIDATANPDGSYQFVMPAYDVTVSGQYISVAAPEIVITENADGTICAEVNKLNESAVIMIALYRANGQMLSIQNYSVGDSIDVAGAASAKAFLLDDSNNLCPISNAAIWTAES